MRKRNPEDQAYRAWESDPSNREALKHYVLSLARSGEMPNIEHVIDIDQALDENNPLRSLYEMFRPNHDYFQKQAYTEDFWRSLIKRYSGRLMTSDGALFLNMIGRRAGIDAEVIYNELYSHEIITRILRDLSIDLGWAYGRYERIIYCISELSKIGPPAAVAIPEISLHMRGNARYFESDQDNKNARLEVLRKSLWALAKIRKSSAIAIPDILFLMDKNNINSYDIRNLCGLVLGVIGASAGRETPRVVKFLMSKIHDDWEIQNHIVHTLGCIGPASSPAVPDLIFFLNPENDGMVGTQIECVKALGKIGQAASVAIPEIEKYSANSIYPHFRKTCSEAIARIRGTHP